MQYLKLFEDFKYVDFINTENYKKGDYHQAIMDVGYNMYQKDDNDPDQDIFKYMESNFGKDFKMMIQIGNYNYQVGNGGHHQYWMNGYAAAETGGCMTDHKECGTLSDMIQLIENSQLYKNYDTPKKVLPIMKDLEEILEEYDSQCKECNGQGYFEEHCDSCNGEGSTEEECCDDLDCSWCEGSGNFTEECEYCDGNGVKEEDCYNCDSGEVNLEVSHLDNPYYDIYEKFMDECNDYSKRIIDNYYNVNKALKKINN